MAASSLTIEKLYSNFNREFTRLINKLQHKTNTDVDTFQQKIAEANAGITNGSVNQEQIDTLHRYMRSAGDMHDIVKTNAGRIRAATTADETYLIRKVGGHIYDYREKIVKRDEQFFIGSSYSDLAGDTHTTIDSNDSKKMFDYIRTMYSSEDTEGRDAIYKSVCRLLALYVNYRLKTIQA